jgi:protein phosphatase
LEKFELNFDGVNDMPVRYAAGTDAGRRNNNQDSYVCDESHGLWLVADGVGGLESGEVASAISAYTITTMIFEGHGVNQSIEAAHQSIRSFAESEAAGVDMAAALVLLFEKGSFYNIFWAGDSRAYLYGDGLTQLTRDHTYAQSLIDAGDTTVEEAEADEHGGHITKALGVRALDAVRADSLAHKWRSGQKILLCSDGLSGYVSDEQIEEVIAAGDSDEAKIERLIDLALKQGSSDNITAILVAAPQQILDDDDDDDTEIPQALVLDRVDS